MHLEMLLKFKTRWMEPFHRFIKIEPIPLARYNWFFWFPMKTPTMCALVVVRAEQEIIGLMFMIRPLWMILSTMT